MKGAHCNWFYSVYFQNVALSKDWDQYEKAWNQEKGGFVGLLVEGGEGREGGEGHEEPYWYEEANFIALAYISTSLWPPL